MDLLENSKLSLLNFFCHFFPYHIIMESWSLQGESIINDIRNLFILRKELNYTAIEDIRNLFRQEKEIKAMKEKIFRDIKNLFEYEEEENYYKLVRVKNFWSNNYIWHVENWINNSK